MTTMDIFHLEEALWIATAPTDVPAYDFDFGSFFVTRRPWERPTPIEVVGRFGAAPDYAACFADMKADGIDLIHSPEMHERSSELPAWYPLIEAFTPYSRWFETPPSVDEIEASFNWPVFIKGSRQTSRHKADLAIIQTPEHYRKAIEKIATDPILNWQALVVREFLPLRPVDGGIEGKIPTSFEFRTFWWRGECVGEGQYNTSAHYNWTTAERTAAMKIARAAVDAVDVTFVVVDLAQTVEGRWVVIELNDGQESGYVGVPPTAVWQNITTIERARNRETGLSD